MNTPAPAVNPALLKLVRLYVNQRAALGEHQRLQSTLEVWVRQKRELDQALAELRNRPPISRGTYSDDDIRRFTRQREQDIAKHEGALALVAAAVDLLQARIEEAERRSKSADETFRSLRLHLKRELEALGVDLE